MNPMGKHITKTNTTSENMTYLVDKKINQYIKMHPLTVRRGKYI